MILITGAILGGLAVVGIIFIFVYLIIKQDRLKKLPVWIYVLAVTIFLIAIVSIFLVIFGGLQNK